MRERWKLRLGASFVGSLLVALSLPGTILTASDIQIQDANTNSGSWAARLAVNRTCTAGDETVPNGSISSDPAVEPCGDLTANDVDIVSGSSVRFRAGRSLILGDGFSVAASATFVAEVGETVLGASYLRDESPNAEPAYSVRFYVDPTNLNLTVGSQQFDHFIAYDAQGNREFVLGVTYNSGLSERRLFAAAYENTGTVRSTKGVCEQVLPAGWHFVETHWKASTGSDGDLEVSIDGGVFQSLASCLSLAGGVLNSNGEISFVDWGVHELTDSDLGSMDLDDFDSRQGSDIGGI